MGNHDHHTNHCKNPTKCVNYGVEHLSRSNECATWKKKKKEISRLKVTKNITYPEARKLFEQKPEFSFSKIVKSLAAKPETKTTSTQYSVEDSKITESTKVIIPRKQRQITNPQNQKLTNKPSAEQTNIQIKQNQPNTNTKPQQRPNIASNRLQKGSDDPIKQHNRFGALADDGDMDTDENTTRQGAHTSRSRSPIIPPK